MPRVREIELAEVPPELQPTYSRYANEYGPFLNQVKVFAQRPPALKHIMGLLLDLADEAMLPKRYLEIAIVTVSKLNECEYCVVHHTPKLIELGISPDIAENILADDVPGLDEVDRLVRDYAIQVSTDPRRISDQQFTRLRTQFSEEQIVELTLRIALCGFFNRFNEALQIDLEDSALAGMLAVSNPSHQP